MKKTALSLVMTLALMGAGVKGVMAGPHLTLSPSAGNYTVGSEFTVTIGVDSGTEKTAAIDIWANFDLSKLEVVSITKTAPPDPNNDDFPFSLGQNIKNSEGKFDVSCTSSNMSGLETVAIKRDLVAVVFKAKAEGVASLNFSCSSGSSIDTNIFNASAVDVIECSSNQSGSYTITAASSGGTSEPTATPTPTTAATTTTTSSSLPQTGVIENTVGLVVFGLMSVLGAAVLRWL